MGFSSQAGTVAFRTQATPAVFPADFATACVAMKLKTGALAANRDLLIPDPEIGGGRDVNDAFLGAVTFTGDYEFYVRINGTLTLLNAALGIHIQGPGGTQDVQTLTMTGAPTGGTFTLTYATFTTTAIPYNATAIQVQKALEALSGVGVGSVVVTGGPFIANTIKVTFDGLKNGTTTLITATNTGLVGGTSPAVTITHTTTGATNTPVFLHVFLPSDLSQLPFIGIEERIANVFDVFRYTDSVVNTLHFEADANGYFMGTAGMIARLQAAQASAVDVSNFFDNGDLMVGTNVTVTFGGVTLAAKSFKFDLDNQFAADDFRLGSFYIGDLTPKRRMCTVGVTIREQDKNLWRQATYGASASTSVGGVITKQNVVITVATYSNIPGSSPLVPYSMSIEMPYAALKPYALKVSGDDIIDSDIEFQALRPFPAYPLCRVRVQTDTATMA
jgi:hypothetical protein